MPKPHFEMDQFIGLQLGQDWVDDYDDPYEAAEAGILERSDELLAALHREIGCFVSSLPEEDDWLCFFQLNGAFPNSEAFGAWLAAVRARIEQALAGIHSEPMSAPEGFRRGM